MVLGIFLNSGLVEALGLHEPPGYFKPVAEVWRRARPVSVLHETWAALALQRPGLS